MIEFIKVCGIVGFIILLLTPVLLLLGILIAVLCKSRKPLAIFAVVAFIPLLLGLLGTAAGYSQVHSVSGRLEPPDAALIQHGRAQARYTSYLGAGCTILLWLICALGAATKRENAEPENGNVRE